MGFRRNRTDGPEAKHWADFTERHQGLIIRAHLPPSVTDTEDRWHDFLMHGCIDHHDDPFNFTVRGLSLTQYQALVQLLTYYLEEGNEVWFDALVALRGADIDRLRRRFDTDKT
jgi:hypothetical protein